MSICVRTHLFASVCALLVAGGGFAQPANQAPWQGEYAYDGAGSIKAIGANHYRYDGARRLVEGTAVTSAQSDVRNYFYDAFGNLREVRTNQDAAHPTIIGANPSSNRITDSSRCFGGSNCVVGQYDTAGHQITGSDGSHYGYDAAGMMSTLDNGARREAYIYDANDQRIATISNAATAPSWRYTPRDAAANVMREWTSTGNSWSWTKDYVHRGGALLGTIDGASGAEVRTHFHLDHLGTPRLITDDEGRRVSVHTYWPFGLEASGSDSDAERMKYTGHERDFAGAGSINDLDYMHARYYSPVASRFLSIDPHPARPEFPGEWNRYTYASNSPLSAIDPNGKWTVYMRSPNFTAVAGPGVNLSRTYSLSSNGDVAEILTEAGGSGTPQLTVGISLGYNKADSTEEFAEKLSGLVEVGFDAEHVTGVPIEIGGAVSIKGEVTGGQINVGAGASASPISFFGGVETTQVINKVNVPDEVAKVAKKTINAIDRGVEAISVALNPTSVSRFSIVEWIKEKVTK